MKKLKLALLLALVGAGVATQSAQAQLSYTNGDLFIGFRNTGSTIATDYLTDIGQATLYTQNNGSTFTVGNFGADLSSVTGFGSTWQTGGKTLWGVIGTDLPSDPGATIYAGHRETAFGTFPVNPGSSYLRDTTGNQTGYQTAEETMKNDYQSTGIATVNNPNGTFQLVSDPSSWAAFSQTPSFGVYSGFETAINGTTTAGHAIDLFQIAPDDATPGTLSPVYEGRFVISNTGVVTYTSAVPEPSTLAAIVGGLGVLCFLRRRRAMTA